MKPGDLARITVPIPSLFESIGSEPTRVIKQGDLVLLLKHEPNRWYWPCWQVLYYGEIGVIASRWLASAPAPHKDFNLDTVESDP